MDDFNAGQINLANAAMERARERFSSACVDDDATLDCIARVWKESGYLLDPHSAIGFEAAQRGARESGDTAVPWVTLATAHPAKFPEAIAAADIATQPRLPAHLSELFERDEHFDVLPNDLRAVQQFMADHLGA
jgi:threonine synthase